MEKYQPEKVCLLFIAEAPSSAEKQFYFTNTNLYKAIKNGFETVFGAFISDASFLEFFQSAGCYLEYLCPEGVDRTSVASRKDSYENRLPYLAGRLRSMQPQMIIVLMKSMEKTVVKSVQLSGISSLRIQSTPFPAHSEKNRLGCITGIASALKVAVENHIIP